MLNFFFYMFIFFFRESSRLLKSSNNPVDVRMGLLLRVAAAMRRRFNVHTDNYVGDAQSAVFSQSEITSILSDINIVECLCSSCTHTPMTLSLILKSIKVSLRSLAVAKYSGGG